MVIYGVPILHRPHLTGRSVESQTTLSDPLIYGMVIAYCKYYARGCSYRDGLARFLQYARQRAISRKRVKAAPVPSPNGGKAGGVAATLL